MTKRGLQVNDPNSIVLIDNVSDALICLPREHSSDLIFSPGRTVQVTWAEYINYKNIPYFGQHIKLNKSVIISDGKVIIKNMDANLTEEEMIATLVQDVDRIKEFVLQLNEGERELFKTFLQSRIDIGIEEEKCESLLYFMDKRYSEKKEAKAKPEEVAPEPAKRGRRPNKGPKIIENEESLSAHVQRDGDSE